MALLMWSFFEILLLHNSLSSIGYATFELKPIQIWLSQNSTFFYVHNFIELYVLLVLNPILDRTTTSLLLSSNVTP